MGLVSFSKRDQRAALLSASPFIMPARKQLSVSQEENPHQVPSHADWPLTSQFLEMWDINGQCGHPAYGCFSSLSRPDLKVYQCSSHVA